VFSIGQGLHLPSKFAAHRSLSKAQLVFQIFRRLGDRRQWLNALRNQGRAIAAAELIAAYDSGTLIVNRTDAGFMKANCWWTPDDVAEIAPCGVPTDDERKAMHSATIPAPHEFDDWCVRTYIATETGTARLILPVQNGARMAQMLKNQRPRMNIILSSSAHV
jgi:hypothetical protein